MLKQQRPFYIHHNGIFRKKLFCETIFIFGLKLESPSSGLIAQRISLRKKLITLRACIARPVQF